MYHPQTYTIPGGFAADLNAFSSKYSMYKLSTMGLTGDPIATPSTSHRIYFERKSMYCVDRTQVIP